jgi:hypothetical protein
LISGLQQRLLSSVEAFARTLRVHRRTVQKHTEVAGAGRREREDESAGPLLFAQGIDNDDDRATLSEEELQAEEESQIEAATQETSSSATSATFARERQLLDEIAEAARSLPDARVRRLVDWIREQMCPGLPPLGRLACCRVMISAIGKPRCSLPSCALMMISQALTTLSNTVFAESQRAVSATVESFAGLLSHQINV